MERDRNRVRDVHVWLDKCKYLSLYIYIYICGEGCINKCIYIIKKKTYTYIYIYRERDSTEH